MPPLDEELLLRARAALETKCYDRCRNLLEAAEDWESQQWNLLRGQLEMAREAWAEALKFLRRVEEACPERALPLLEICCRELGDYKGAYEYACRQKGR